MFFFFSASASASAASAFVFPTTRRRGMAGGVDGNVDGAYNRAHHPPHQPADCRWPASVDRLVFARLGRAREQGVDEMVTLLSPGV